MHGNSEFKDILEERRQGGDAKWAARTWNPVAAYTVPRRANPITLKHMVLHSSRLKNLINQISEDEGVSTEDLYKQVAYMLDEMGYRKEMPVLRWLGLFTSKILKRLFSEIYVNESTLLKVKNSLGRNPVLFVPTHRSYGDFILMSYVCFHYELDIPRIAAGMDFHGMTFIGEMLRDSCAFFMRRTFSQDKLYSATFSEYVQALVTHGDGAVEFFIEGTRSRTAKSLMPKFGFLSMALKPFLTGQVPDISIIPVNICYDRCLEEFLFAYELLGVPKPKESTKGFIKALNILNDDYGKVYISFGEAISVADTLRGCVDRSMHTFGPVVVQDFTTNESREVVGLAHKIIASQRKLTVLTCFNIVAAIINWKSLSCPGAITLTDVVEDVRWLTGLLRSLDAIVNIDDKHVEEFVRESIRVHKNLIHETGGKIRLRQEHNSNFDHSTGNRRGCELSSAIMNMAIPFVVLQHYVNPCCQFLADCSLVVLSLASTTNSRLKKDELLQKLLMLYKLFSHEFVFHDNNMQQAMELSIHKLLLLKAIQMDGDYIVLKGDSKVAAFTGSFLAPFLPVYFELAVTIHSTKETTMHEFDVCKKVQCILQSKICYGPLYHPASLSLDTCSNAIQSLCSMKILQKTKGNGSLSLNSSALQVVLHTLSSFMAILPSRNAPLASIFLSRL